jgi:NAD(P)-dependent dehydrogenase (short-subunit alcohol dehydrogenase family)
MSRIFITGSSDGLGKLAATILLKQGHSVVLHARNSERAEHTLHEVPGAERVLVADLSNKDEIKKLASEANATGRFDAVIHNAGVYRVSNQVTFVVNSLAPYMLTCLMDKPQRLIYLSSGLHMQGSPEMSVKAYNEGRFNYSDTKLHVILLAKAISRKWSRVYANSVNPGWVPTKMGGSSAPDDLYKGAETQAWLAVSGDPEALVSGKYFFHKKEKQSLSVANDEKVQELFLSLCENITAIPFPSGN